MPGKDISDYKEEANQKNIIYTELQEKLLSIFIVRTLDVKIPVLNEENIRFLCHLVQLYCNKKIIESYKILKKIDVNTIFTMPTLADYNEYLLRSDIIMFKNMANYLSGWGMGSSLNKGMKSKIHRIDESYHPLIYEFIENSFITRDSIDFTINLNEEQSIINHIFEKYEGYLHAKKETSYFYGYLYLLLIFYYFFLMFSLILSFAQPVFF